MTKAFKKISVPEPVAVLNTTTVPLVVDPQSHHLPELSPLFLFAGKALFTVNNVETNEHVTYKVRGRESEWPKGSGKRSTSFFLNVKASGGKYAFRYIGVVNPDGTVRLTVKSEFGLDAKEYTVGAWACQVVVAGKMISNKYHIQHANKCGKCGLTLTDPQSIERGIGPECWKTVGGSQHA